VCHKGQAGRQSVRPDVRTTHSRNVTLPVGLYGCETGSVTLREEHRLRVSENRVQREVRTARSFIICTARQILLG
jgi:hypothetical protein